MTYTGVSIRILSIQRTMHVREKSTIALQPIGDVVAYALPTFQRNVNMKHVMAMVEDQTREYEKWHCFSILQAVTVAHVRDDKVYVLDGQHRLCAFRELCKLGYPINDVLIPVVMYDVFDQVEMAAYYGRVNHNMPIHPLELEDDFKDFAKVIIDKLVATYGMYIKNDSKNSRCPHINMNDLKKNLSGRNLSAKLKERHKSVGAYWDKIQELNGYVHENVKATHQLCQMMQKRITDCESKTQKAGGGTVCYLGVWRRFEWLDLALEALLEDKEFTQISLACDDASKKSIPACIRLQVWKKTNVNQSDAGLCFTCCNDLYYSDMECGHIKARALGGDDTVDNLMSICKTCNKDMGIMNLLEYKEMIEAMSR